MEKQLNLSDIYTLQVTFGRYFDFETYYFRGEKNLEIEGTDNVIKKFPELASDDKDEFKLTIRVSDGKILNWPIGYSLELYNWKIVDGGTYALLNSNNEEIVKYTGYVPKCFGDKYGDYFEFDINEEGFINEWKFDQSDVDQIVKNAEKFGD